MKARIIITGDAHHGLRTRHHKAGFNEEHLYSREYLEILRRMGLRSTLFVTGKQIAEHTRFWQRIIRDFDVEIGGHTHSAMDWYPPGVGMLFKAMFKARYGPRFIQQHDINLCAEAFQSAQLSLFSWRTHEYQSNDATRQILKTAGVRVISDSVRPGVRIKNGSLRGSLVELPINVLPDHENIQHGNQIGMDSQDYKELVLRQIKALAKPDCVVVLLLHPVCMKVLDRFDTFKEICHALRGYTSLQCRNV